MASELIVQTLKGPTSGANANKIIVPSGQTLDASAGFVPPAGSVLQVVQTVMDNDLTYNTTSKYDLPGMAVTITPKSASSKFLISCNLHYGQGDSNNNDYTLQLRLKRNGSLLSYTSNGNKMSGDYTAYRSAVDPLWIEAATFERLDSPNTTSALTYQVEAWNGSWSTNAVCYNTVQRTDNANYSTSRTRSTLTVTEIAG